MPGTFISPDQARNSPQAVLLDSFEVEIACFLAVFDHLTREPACKAWVQDIGGNRDEGMREATFPYR